MFTGIITEIGRVSGTQRVGGSLQISAHAPGSAPELAIGGSVSVQGVCQTVIARGDSWFRVEAVEETLRKTTLGGLQPGDPVNLELPLRFSDRLGGHIVQGHVDGVGTVQAIEEREGSRLVTVEFSEEFSRYVVPVGSIAIDGVSLTVAVTSGNRLTVSLIPHTMAVTALSRLQVGSRVNLEFDLLGKYVEKLVLSGSKQGPGVGVTEEKLREWGYLR